MLLLFRATTGKVNILHDTADAKCGDATSHTLQVY